MMKCFFCSSELSSQIFVWSKDCNWKVFSCNKCIIDAGNIEINKYRTIIKNESGVYCYTYFGLFEFGDGKLYSIESYKDMSQIWYWDINYHCNVLMRISPIFFKDYISARRYVERIINLKLFL